MALTKWDDYYIHQNFSTLDKIQSEDENAYERACMTCASPDGAFYLAIALGIYPNRKITDAGIGIRYGNTQRSMFISKPFDAENDRGDFMLGPFHAKIIEPMKLWQIDLAGNDYGIGCSLMMEGRSAPWEAPVNWGQSSFPSLSIPIALSVHQSMRYSGTITFEGKEYSADGFLGGRDRTWGIRPVAEDPGKGFKVLGMENWLFAHFSNYSVFLAGINLNQAVLGKESEYFFSNIWGDDGTVTPLSEIRHRVEFLQPFEKQREYAKEEWLMKDPAGKERHLVIRPISRSFYLGGVGYDGRQGKDFGGFHIEGDTYDVSNPTVIGDKHWGIEHRVCEFQLDGDKGVGTTESIFSPLPDWKYKPTW